MRVEYHPAIEGELREIKRYYEDRSPGLGIQFIDEFERQVFLLAANPERWMVASADIRWCLMRRFPYIIYFRHQAEGKAQAPLGIAQYLETPSERADGQWYVAFLFRDTGRALFGIHEFIDRLPHDKDLRHMATRVIVDDDYRESMLSDRAELPKWWKRH